MQLLDDDMDELFRNAASQYPLKTDGADWDALSRRLQSAQPQGTAVDSVRGNKWVWLVVSILLTILFFITYAPPLETGKLPRTGTVIETNTAIDKGTAARDTNDSVSGKNPATNTNSVANSNSIAKTNSVTKTNSVANSNTISKTNSVAKTNSIANSNSNSISKTNTFSNKNTSSLKHTISLATDPGLTINRQHPGKTTNENNIQTSGPVIDVATSHSALTFAAVPTILPADSTTTPAIAVPVQHIPLPEGTTLLRTGMPVTTATPVTAAPITKKQSPAQVQTGLYFGIIASPDISTVKMQHVEKVGYGAGIILGYRISRSFAVETGLLYDHKNYYSEGSYFNKEKIPYIQDWKIVNVDGYCNMYEIPVNVRYFIKNGKNTSWYANAGLSSYLMKKEDYAYKYMTMSGDLKNSSWAYTNATQNWFSIIHVGVGLEHNLGAIGKLRVEPYLKIPAKGLGIGDLPITSMGINIGITKSIR